MAYKQSPFPLITGTSPVKQAKIIQKGLQLAKKVKSYFTKPKPKPQTFKYNVEPSKSGSGGYIRGKEGSYIPYTGKYTKKGQKITQDFTKKFKINTPEAKEAHKLLVK